MEHTFFRKVLPCNPPEEILAQESIVSEHLELVVLPGWWEDGIDHRFAIILKETGGIIGQIGITNIIRNVAQSAFIGYWIGDEYLNHGYATEALVSALHYSFELARLHRISLWIVPTNAPSLKMAAKLKLRYEGRALRSLNLGGNWQDTDIFAITYEEWIERKDELYKLLHQP